MSSDFPAPQASLVGDCLRVLCLHVPPFPQACVHVYISELGTQRAAAAVTVLSQPTCPVSSHCPSSGTLHSSQTGPPSAFCPVHPLLSSLYQALVLQSSLSPQCPHAQSVSSVAQSSPTLCDPVNRSMPGLPVHHQLPEFTQTLVHRVGDAIQPSHPLSSPSPPVFNLSRHQGLFQ